MLVLQHDLKHGSGQFRRPVRIKKCQIDLRNEFQRRRAGRTDQRWKCKARRTGCQERSPFELEWVDAAGSWDSGSLEVTERSSPARGTGYRRGMTAAR